MKYISIITYTLASLVTGCIASDSTSESYIQISVKNTWTILVSQNGQLCLKSMIDSNPMSMACTAEKIVDFNKTKSVLTSGNLVADDTLGTRAYGFVRQKHEEGFLVGNKYQVDENLLFNLLHEACRKKQWLGAGMNNRLLTLLDQNPILEDKEMQNKALQPTR